MQTDMQEGLECCYCGKGVFSNTYSCHVEIIPHFVPPLVHCRTICIHFQVDDEAGDAVISRYWPPDDITGGLGVSVIVK